MTKKLLAIVLVLLPVTLLAAKKNIPSGLTVISYNIRNGEANDGPNSWQYRYPYSAMMIQDQMPDILGVQEAYDYQVKYLDEYCKGFESVGVGRENGKKEGEHMSIFYNKKTVALIKWGTFWLSETPDKPSRGWDGACTRTATWALMRHKATGKKFLFVNTHLDHVGRQARAEGLALIMEKIEELGGGLPVVLSGDFNSEPGDPCLERLSGKLLSARDTAVSSDGGTTYNAWGKKDEASVIDHIFFRGFGSCTTFEVIRTKYGDRNFISDHYPVKAVLMF